MTAGNIVGVIAVRRFVLAGSGDVPAEQFPRDGSGVHATCGEAENELYNGCGIWVGFHSAIGAFAVAVGTDFALILAALHLGVLGTLGFDGHIAAVILADEILERPAITLSNINKRFGEKVLFRDYSLHIEAGEFVAIKGESGAGKTTLLNIIGLLETPDSGSVTLCGARNPSFSSRAAVHLRRHKLSYLFQNYGLVDTDTVEANMKLATRFGKAKGKAEKERIADALAQVGLSGYERRKVYTLSGGEQQRVALAKIIAKSPDIILADEPTGSLDERNRSYVMDILKELNRQGKTIVVVTHDPYVSDCATRHIAL